VSATGCTSFLSSVLQLAKNAPVAAPPAINFNDFLLSTMLNFEGRVMDNEYLNNYP